MGKKRKIISKPQKFNKKHANHPLVKVALKSEEVKEVVAEPKPEIKKPEPKPEIKKPEPVAVVKESKPETKKVEVNKAPTQRRRRKTPVATKKTKPSND